MDPLKLVLVAESETEAIPNIVLHLDEAIFSPRREPIWCWLSPATFSSVPARRNMVPVLARLKVHRTIVSGNC
jgi:hypothetical protein